MNSNVFREISRLIPLFLVVLIIAIGARFVSNIAIDNTAQKNAQSSASVWASNIVEYVPQLEEILSGEKIASGDVMMRLANAQPSEIKAYRIYNHSKILRLERAGNGVYFDETRSLGDDASAMIEKILIGKASSYKKISFASNTDASYGSKILIPLKKNGRKLGYIEILSVETSTFVEFREHFSLLSLEFTILMLASFLLPAILYFLRTIQLDAASKKLRYSADHDELTGVLNRSAFTKIVEKELELASGRGYSVGLHFLDLDKFKEINDTRGHGAGDEVLKKTAKRIKSFLGPREHLARLGGDEFAIVQPYFTGSSNSVNILAKKIVTEMTKPFEIEGLDVQIGASLGYSHFPRDGKTVSELLQKSDIALYKAKLKGRNRATEFDPSMNDEQMRRHAVENRLRFALENEEFSLKFQPYFDFKTNDLRGFEALLRLNDEKGKAISPAVFIPIAEEIGLIGDIGAWVLLESCRIAKDWPQDLMVSVNLSPEQFKTYNMQKFVSQALKTTGFSANRLELEVTEGLLITDTDNVLDELLAIKELGVSIALDDFGTGYSSLSYLWQFPFDKLKVDKSFVNKLGVKDSKSREILSTIIALGKVLNLKVTAEGVETKEQCDVLKSMDCDYCQGYLTGRPMDAIDVAATIIKTHKTVGKPNAKIKLKLKQSA